MSPHPLSSSFRRVVLIGFIFAVAATFARAAELNVFAAASLSESLQEIGRRYETTHQDHVHFNFAGSNTLARQITEGAPADLFFSADEAKMDDLNKKTLIVPEFRRSLLSNTLVVVVNTKRPAAVKSVADLATDKVSKLALAQTQTVPAGIYARAYLQQIGLWSALQSKVVECENVRATLAAVATDNADAGIVYKTDSLISKDVQVVVAIPAAEGPRISYPVAVLSHTAARQAADSFLAYLETPEALTIFEKYGFTTLPAPVSKM